MPPDLQHELKLGVPVCGVDEAGRGPLAGPVVAAAVLLDLANVPAGIDDSKKLDAARREALYDIIMTRAQVGIGSASVAEIDTLNILQATMLSMQRAVAAIAGAKHVLVDGNRPPKLALPVTCIVGGDARSLSIAAASIVAKVTRDRIMVALHEELPDYGFAQHKGYGTAEHLVALRRLGPSPHHRLSFAPVRESATQHLVSNPDKSLNPK